MMETLFNLGIKSFFPALALALITYFVIVVKRIYNQKSINNLESIKLEGEQIALKVQGSDIDTLISDSNKRHGILAGSPVGPATGDAIKKR